VTIQADGEDWVAESLKQLYRSTLDEGIPDDMMALLDALDDDETSDDSACASTKPTATDSAAETTDAADNSKRGVR
jgi:hypothetical protein